MIGGLSSCTCYSNSRRWHLISSCTRKVPTCSVGAVTLSSRPAQAVLPMALSLKLSPLLSPCPQSSHALHLTRGSGNPPTPWWWFGPPTCPACFVVWLCPSPFVVLFILWLDFWFFSPPNLPACTARPTIAAEDFQT